MATLKGKTISETYPLLLKIASSGVDGTLRNVEDGDGTTSALQISTGAINVSGTITASGNVDFNGDLDVDGTTNLDVVDIDGAVDMASTLAVADDITLANNKYYEVKDSGGSAIRLLGLDNSNNIYMGFVDDATGTGSLYLRTGGTNALTIDNSQNATFAGTINSTIANTQTHSENTEPNSTTEFLTLHNNSGSDGAHTDKYVTIKMAVGSGAASEGHLIYRSSADNQGEFIFNSRHEGSTYNDILTLKSDKSATFAGTITVGASNGSEEVKANRTRVRHIDGLADASDYSHGDLYINHISSGNIICSSNVGIGTTSPASLLHIESDSADPTLRITNKTAAAINTGPDIEFWNNPFTGSTTNSYESGAIRVRKTSGSDNNHDHYMSFETRKNSPEGINEHMRITSDGKIGCGTDSPRNTIHSTGIVEISNADSNSDTERIRFGRTSDNQRYSSIFHKLSDSASNNFITFKMHNGSSQIDALKISGDGNGVVTVGGDLSVADGDVQLANGRGISFSNMPNNANMTSELFDDYEEGTISTSVNGITASTNDVSGTYTKIGRLVHLEVRVTISGKSGGTGNPYILLPFNASGAGIGASIVGAQISKNTIITGGSPAYLGLYGSTNQIYANDVSGNYIGDGDWGNGVMGFNLVYNT